MSRTSQETGSKSMLDGLRAELDRFEADSQRRVRRLLESPQGVEVRVDGESLVSFCSNDYLGLANDVRVRSALAAAVETYGVGSGASHLISGHARPHHDLETELAAFVGCERALLFSTGYMANLAVVTTLVARGGHVFEDRLNHASLIDAARLSGARVRRFQHRDVERLSDWLPPLPASEGQLPDHLLATDGVFSMDGDMARLPELVRLAERSRSWLLVDDAHGLGVLGPRGAGSFEYYQLPIRAPAILMGTLGKAFGTFGAFVAAEREVIDYLVQRARPYIYTTALPPALAEASRASLAIVEREGWRREQLNERIRQFRDGARSLGLPIADSTTPIQLVMRGSAAAAVAASEELRRSGILVPAIRPPTVPANRSRLRITFSALHTARHVDRLLDTLAGLGR